MHKILWPVSIALSSLLLFCVQPMLTKFVLPWFGGNASVWIASLLFFQVTLLLGYGYAFVLSRIAMPFWQLIVHAIVVALSVAWLPITPEFYSNSLHSPLSTLLLTFTLSILGPGVVLSATSPLLQHWWSGIRTEKSAYRFFALSNAFSIFGLFLYPLVIERVIGLESQTYVWSISYLLFASVTLLAMFAVREKLGRVEAPENEEGQALSLSVPLRWIYLSFIGALLLLSMSRTVSTDIAPFPLMWIVPLGIYLVTFVISFSHERFHHLPLMRYLMGVCLLLQILLFSDVVDFALWQELLLLLLSLFAFCTLIHGELVQSKPARQWLTLFYLALAFGGCLGGLAANVFAPLFFTFQIEMYLCAGFVFFEFVRRWAGVSRYSLVILYGFALVMVHLHSIRHQVFSARNFYGYIQITDEPGPSGYTVRTLRHGTTRHGAQVRNGELQRTPVSYYSPRSGIGKLFRHYGRSIPSFGQGDGPLRVAAVGLGAGAISAYMEPGDSLHYLEINPVVVTVATKFFSYLGNSPIEETIAVGDGRLLLEQELEQNGSLQVDILVLDAFNSDFIPTHLLTKEALSVYWSHLKQDGVLAVLYDSGYSDLLPILKGHASRSGKELIHVFSPGESEMGVLGVSWAFLTSRKRLVSDGVFRGKLLDVTDGAKHWTDDHADIWSTLRW